MNPWGRVNELPSLEARTQTRFDQVTDSPLICICSWWTLLFRRSTQAQILTQMPSRLGAFVSLKAEYASGWVLEGHSVSSSVRHYACIRLLLFISKAFAKYFYWDFFHFLHVFFPPHISKFSICHCYAMLIKVPYGTSLEGFSCKIMCYGVKKSSIQKHIYNKSNYIYGLKHALCIYHSKFKSIQSDFLFFF